MNCAKVIYLKVRQSTCGSLNIIHCESCKKSKKKKEKKGKATTLKNLVVLLIKYVSQASAEEGAGITDIPRQCKNCLVQ